MTNTPHTPALVAYLGPAGTFTEQALHTFAATQLHSRGATGVPVDSPRRALDMLRAGEVDYACVAIESSVDGSITQTEDALISGDTVQILAETVVPIAFSIMTRPGVNVAEARSISCHPVAYAQIRGWLEEHVPHLRYVAASSNGAAAQAVADGDVDVAAAPPRAAEIHNLAVHATGIADRSDARTRFILVGQPQRPPAPTGDDRTFITLSLPDRPASLQEALTELSIRGVDMCRIGSRPLPMEDTAMGPYVFHIDLVGHIEEDAIGEAIAALKRRAGNVWFHGSWAAQRSASTGATLTSTSDDAANLHTFADSLQWVEQLRIGKRH